MKDWYASHPHLFIKRPYDHPGCDTYKTKHREQGAGFFKGKVFEFLTHHCRQGNEHVIAMIRNCLPKPLAALKQGIP
jgi:hypothetical protein